MKSVFTDRYAEMLRLLIAARKARPLTQVELAELLKKPESFVQNMNRGRSGWMLSS